MAGQSLISSDNYSYGGGNESKSSISSTPAFIESAGVGCIKCHGRIIEVDHQDLFYSKFHKVINSVFRGEAYQFGHQTSEYLIRVEELGSTYSMQCADFSLYGNYMGCLMTGDEVRIIAKDNGNKRIVKSIFNVSTNRQIKPGLQLPASIIRIFLTVVAIMIGMLVTGLVSYLGTGEGKNTVVTIILIICIGWFIKNWIRRKIFNRRW